MEPRIAKPEQIAEKTGARLDSLDRELVRIEHSIKAELHKEIGSSIRCFVGWVTTVGVVLTAAVYFIARHVPA